MRATFELLAAANSTIKTTDIKGKNYAMVQERVKAFRMLYPEGRIVPEIVSLTDGECIFKATCYDDRGSVIGVGHAQEIQGSSNINKTSYIENCETSAVGRALAFCGIGIDVSIASYEEVEQAIANQPISNVTARALLKLLEENDIEVLTILRLYKVKSIEDLSDNQHRNIHENLDKIFDKQQEWKAEQIAEEDKNGNESKASSDVSESGNEQNSLDLGD